MKKISAILLAAVLCTSVFFMTACGDDNKNSDSASASGQQENSETKNPFETSEASDQESQPAVSEVSSDESKSEDSQTEEQESSEEESTPSMPEEESKPEDSEDEDESDDEDSEDTEDSEDDEDSEFEDIESLPEGEVNAEYAGTWKSGYDFSSLDEDEAAIIKSLLSDINMVMVLSADGSASIVTSSYDEPDETGTGSWNANGNNIYVEIDGMVESFIFSDGKLTSEALPYIVFTRS